MPNGGLTCSGWRNILGTGRGGIHDLRPVASSSGRAGCGAPRLDLVVLILQQGAKLLVEKVEVLEVLNEVLEVGINGLTVLKEVLEVKSVEGADI